jgi:mannose-6-phosphate isomerase-like protein (cupin superfamily)
MNRVITKNGTEVTSQDIADARSNIDLLYIPNFCRAETPWREFIAHADYLAKHQDLTLHSPVPVLGALQMWGDFFHAGYYIDNSNSFHQLDQLKEKTNLLYGRMPDNGCTLVNFVGMQNMIPVHDDRRDSFYWQALGTVEWRVYENMDNEEQYQVVTVKPGDGLFVPSGLVHSVFAPNPRAALSIFYDHD